MQFRLLLLVVLFLTASASSALAQGKKPGGGGGGSITCPTDSPNFSPTTGTEFQTALDCANPGAIINLTAGQVYEGNFTLRYKTPAYEPGTLIPMWITIQSNGLLNNLLADKRVKETDEGNMAWLKTPSGSTAPVLSTELKTLNATTRGAPHHYKFDGIKFYTNQWVSRLVVLGTATETLASELPSSFVFDRSYFAGSPGEGAKQGLVANGADINVTNSYFKDFKDTANDAQAIIIWNGPGPYEIRNNYLEGSGENIMVGGGDPTIGGLIPGNITIVGNHFYKPKAWLTETSTQKGPAGRKKWRIKNLFELKNATDVMIQGNVFENNWIQADQKGFAIVFTPRNQSGGCRWCKVEHVTFQHNLIKNSVAGFNLLVTDDTNLSGQLNDVRIFNNLLININPNPFDQVYTDSSVTAAGRLIQILNPSTTDPMNVTVDNNTVFQSREVSFSAWQKTSGFYFTDNVVRHNPCTSGNNCGISGDGTAPGNATLEFWFSSPVEVTGNIMFDGNDNKQFPYPDGNEFPHTVFFESLNIDQHTGLPLPTSTELVDYDLLNPPTPPAGVNWDNDVAGGGLKAMIQDVVQTCSETCSLIP